MVRNAEALELPERINLAALGLRPEWITLVMAGDLRHGDVVCLDTREGAPTGSVISVSFAKSGKHGASKMALMMVDMFTGRRYEEVLPTTFVLLAPIVTKRDLVFVEWDRDRDVMSFVDESNGDVLDGVLLPYDPKRREAVLQYAAAQGNIEAVFTIVTAVGRHIVGWGSD